MMVDELLPGLVVAQDILNKYDTVIIAAGLKLTDVHINTLMQMDVDYVFVEEPKTATNLPFSSIPVLPRIPERLEKTQKRQKQIFNLMVEYYKKIYADARNGKPIYYAEVYQLIGELVQEFYKHDDILRLLQRIDTEEEYEHVHGVSVCILSVLIGKWMKLDQQLIYKLAIAAFLSDIGKAKVSQDILRKTDDLNEFERVQTKRHVDYSKNVLAFSGTFDEEVIQAVATHHERLNGSGYPDQKRDDNISQMARIIAVADTFHALISKRPYREAYTVFEATEILWKLAYKELDPNVAERVVKFITAYFVGRQVVLSDGRVGEIILINPYDRFKPLVKVENGFVDLSQDYSYKIVGTVS